MELMKIKYLIFLLFVFIGCTPKPFKLYFERTNEHKLENLQINLKKNVFYFEASDLKDKYTVIGGLIINDENKSYILSFPFESESDKLSPFEKSSSTIIKKSKSENIELYINQTGISFNFPPIGNRGEILSEVDSTSINVFNTDSLILSKEFSGKILKFGGGIYHEHFVKIPENGIYNMNVKLQEKSIISYEMTNKGCFPNFTLSKKNLFVCQKANAIPIKLDFNENCNNPFKLYLTKSK